MFGTRNACGPQTARKNWLTFIVVSVCAVLCLGANELAAGNFYANTSPATVPWPGGVVPYEFTNTLSAEEQQTYLDGLREWELAANVTLVPHTNQMHWVLFTYNTNWIDSVSGGTNPQIVTVSSLSRAQVCHEMGHSFGFTHENIRPDAADYLLILTNNINDEPTNLYWFTIDPTSVTNGPYDYESVMHLGWDFASTNPGVLATQQPKPPNFPRYQFRMGNFCLSPGDRAALAYLYGPPAVPLTNVVTTTADAGPGSLRAAIYFATDHPGTTVSFNLPSTDPGYSNGVFVIHLTGYLPPLVANGMVIDGSTQPGYMGSPLIEVDGSRMSPEAYGPGAATGLLIYSAGNQVKNLSFSGFNWNGLTLEYADAKSNSIAGCYLGTDATGTVAAPNAYQGILIWQGASGNVVGGSNVLSRNVLSGNLQYGVFITGSNSSGNVILGNYIGTDASGSNALPNALSGIIIAGGSSSNLIGGTTAQARNVLSGNSQYGVFITDSNTAGNVVLGNYIGTDPSGAEALPNALSGVIIANGSGGNSIGSTSALSGNVLSGNAQYGVLITDPNTTGNAVLGNFIGTDAGGSRALSNAFGGVLLTGGASDNLIGGTLAGARNVISGQGGYAYGVIVAGEGTTGNLIQGNYIGLGSDGVTAVPNWSGVFFSGGATNNTLGGTLPGAANVVSGNSAYGVFLSDPGTSGNRVEGNLLGTDWTGTNAAANYDDVELQNGATGNFIGGVNSGAGNVIAFAGWAGVILYDAGTTNNSIRGNSIYNNPYLGIHLVGTNDSFPYVTPNHVGAGPPGPNDLQNFPIITNAYGTLNATVVGGTLNSATNATFLIDVYRSFSPDSYDGGYGQGEFYVGTVSVTTDGNGNAAFGLTNTGGNGAGQYFTATATAAGGDTSEFGQAVLAINQTSAAAVLGGPFQSGANGFGFSLTLQTNFNYRVQTATNLAGPVVWLDLTNFTATRPSFVFFDPSASNSPVRYYRVVSP